MEESNEGATKVPPNNVSPDNHSTGVVRTPFTDPVPSAKPKPSVVLNADQQAKYAKLLDVVSAWGEIPSSKGKNGSITDEEIMWLSRECLLRYLRATKWSTSDAAKRLLGTLTWRREYGVEALTADHISPENETGKQIILGFDVEARTCLYLNPGRQNTQASPRQVQHLVFMLERAINIMAPKQESLALLINFKSSKTRSNTAPSLSLGREVLNILQTHYPERLGRSCIVNIPWVVSGFFKLITPFIDPITREKLKFNEDVTTYVPTEQLWQEFGGDVDFVYDHEVYWPALNKICQDRKTEQKSRWEKGGKRYGESEIYLKGGDAPSIGAGLSKREPATTSPSDPEIPIISQSKKEEQEVPLPTQSIGNQSSGNRDVASRIPDPKLTTEGDRE